MNNQDVLNYCHEMLAQPSDMEYIQIRNIISRAYYFTYYECINHVEKRLGWSETSSKGGVHARKISRLLNSSNISKQKAEDAALLYTRMNNLKKLRVRADYNLEISIPRATAVYCVKDAELISIDLSNL